MIGNLADATTALSRFMVGDWTDILSANGTTRIVYIINGVVYKCEGESGVNQTEFEVMSTMSLPCGFAFPAVNLFQIGDVDVIAMEYVDGIAVAECFCLDFEECDETCAPVE